MPVMETVTIINKSGKMVHTGKHLVNIFKDAREAYSEKKASMRSEQRAKSDFKQAQKLLEARNTGYNDHHDSRSVASSRRGHRPRDRDEVSRPPLTSAGLRRVDEGSVASGHSRQRSRSQHGDSRSRRGSIGGGYRAPYMKEATPSSPNLSRRHTDYPPLDSRVVLRPPMPPAQFHRSSSNPNLRSAQHHDPNIDMHLAYGDYDHSLIRSDQEKEIELHATMSKLDHLLIEAKCLSHSAQTIIKNLQANPEAMAAVALTLAELSNILKTMSPGILTALKSSSPAAFALLASPQFLIAGGVALGVTVVMFGGYKIVKKIQAQNEAKKEASRMEEALVWDPTSEMSGIESWRRGIMAADGLGRDGGDDGTSVDGEYITPTAARQRQERVRERRREERAPSVASESIRSERTVRRVESESTIRRKPVPIRTRTEVYAASEAGSRRGSVKGTEIVQVRPGKEKERKSSGLGSIFGSSKREKEEKEREKERKRREKRGRASEF